MKKIAAALGIIALAIAGIALWSYAPTINQFFLQRQAAQDINQKVHDADNAINNYEWFKTQKQKIDQKKRQIQNVQDEIQRFENTYGEDPSEWSRTAQQRYSRLNSRLTGQQQMYEKLVADYNARTSMENRNLFNDSLPYEMEQKFWTGDLR